MRRRESLFGEQGGSPLRILIFGEKLQLEAPSLKLEYAARRVTLEFLKNVVAVDAYVRRHPVDACIVTADHCGVAVARRLREYERVMVSYELTGPGPLRATIEKILASRPKRAA